MKGSYGQVKSTNNVKISTGFSKAKRNTIISLQMTDNRNCEFYDGDKPKNIKNLKSMTSGPIRFPQKVSLRGHACLTSPLYCSVHENTDYFLKGEA